jgi:hypothetical protein
MEPKVVRSYKTKGVKELQAFIEPGTAHYKLKFEGGGEVPASLSGAYTSISMVDTAVFNYINTEKETPKKKTETVSKEEE